jgi:hypothetical protein
MKHLTEEDLVLYHYREALAGLDRHGVESHLRACETCCSEYASLQRVLATVARVDVPDRQAEYGAEVWTRIRPHLERSPRGWGAAWTEWMAVAAAAPLVGVRELLRPRSLALAGTVAALVVVAFIAGRRTGPPPETAQSGSDGAARVARPERVRERILLVAVGEHLEQSEVLLIELVNAPTDTVVVPVEQRNLEDLVSANQLYRQAAARAGDAPLATTLEDLERVLMDIANGPAEVSSVELESLRQRIESQGLLFKIKVMSSRVRARQTSPPPSRSAS